MFGIGGALAAAIWSFLMAKHVAGPRAKTLMVNVLKGETEEDEEIVREIRQHLIRPELQSMTITLPQDLRALPELVSSIPQNLGEVIQGQLDESTKTLGNHFSCNLDGAVAALNNRITEIESKMTGRARFSGDPQAAQSKSVESRCVNQIVDTLDAQAGGNASLMAKARQLAAFLSDVGEDDLADWLDEHPDAIPKVERRIRANPALAQRIQAIQDRLAGAGGASGGGAASRGGYEI